MLPLESLPSFSGGGFSLNVTLGSGPSAGTGCPAEVHYIGRGTAAGGRSLFGHLLCLPLPRAVGDRNLPLATATAPKTDLHPVPLAANARRANGFSATKTRGVVRTLGGNTSPQEPWESHLGGLPPCGGITADWSSVEIVKSGPFLTTRLLTALPIRWINDPGPASPGAAEDLGSCMPRNN